MVQDLTDQKKLKNIRKEENIVTLQTNIRNEEEKQRKSSEVADLCTFWNNFWRLVSFGPKLRETARSQGNFRTDC